MASLRPALTKLRGRCHSSAPQWQQLPHMLQGLQISPKARHTRPLSTLPPDNDDSASKDSFAAAVATDSTGSRAAERVAALSRMLENLNMGLGDEDNAEQHEPAPQRPQPRQSRLNQSSAREDALPPGVTDDYGRTTSTATLTDASQGMARGWDRRGQEDVHQPQQQRQQSAPRQSRDDQEQMENRRRYADQVREGAMAEKQSEEDEDQKDEPAKRIYARAMPTSPSYFSRQATFNDNYLLLRKLMRKNAHLPTVPPNQQIRVAYRSRKDYKLAVGEDIKASDYAKALDLVKRLYKIHPHLRPAAVQDAIADFLRDINPYNQKLKDIPVDKFGRTLGVGKRKTSTARAWVVEGVGEVLVNGKSLADAFGRVHDRESAVWALKATERTDKYNVWALVEGGGTTGQAEALAMAVGKALMAHEPALKPALRRAGVVTRDPRGVERKKPGHVKARKSPAWVKR